jgi:predicted MFS family arabinose efflux permease
VVFALAVPLKRDFALSDTQLSLLMGAAFSTTYVLFGLLLGRLVDRGTRRTIAALGIAGWSLATVAAGLADGYGELLLARAAVGIGEATLAPAAYSMIADLFPPRQVAGASGLFVAGSTVGSGLATLVGGTLAAAAGPGTIALPAGRTIFAWQTVFLWIGLPGLLLAALMLAVREPGRHGAGAAERTVPFGETLAYLRANARALGALFAGAAALGAAVYSVQAWAVTFFVRVHGLSLAAAGTLQGLAMLVAGTAGMIAGGRLADRWGGRGRHAARFRVPAAAAAAAVPLLAGYALVPGRGAAVALFVPLIFFLTAPWGALAAAVADLAPNRLRGQVVAIYLLLQNMVGLGLGPTAVALVTDRVLRDEAALPLALLAVSGSSLAAGFLVLAWGMGGYTATAERAGAWRLNRGGTSTTAGSAAPG